MSAVLITALMALCSVFSISGLVVMHLHRKQQRLQSAQVQDELAAQYAYDPATGLYTLVDATPKVHAYKVGKLQPHKRQAIAMAFCMLAIFLTPLVFMPTADAALSETMRNVFSGDLKDFVTGMMSGDNEIAKFAWMIFAAFSFTLFVIEVIKFIWQGNQTESHLIAVCMFFLTFMIMGSYDGFTEGVWGIAVGISNAYQMQLVGNTDNFFLSQWMHKVFGSVVVEDLSFYDNLKLIGYVWIWTGAGVLLDAVAYLVAMWADFGYAVAKVVGFVFIPCLLLPATRNLFDGWFKFFTGFGFLLIVLKATMVVAAIAVKAIVGTLGVQYGGSGFAGDPSSVTIGVDEMYKLADAAAMLIIAALFVLSSFAFAGALAGGLGNISGGLGTAASLAVRKILR